MRFGEVNLQRIVVFVKPILFKVAAQIARKMKLVQVLFKALHIVEEFLAEVAPRIRQNLSPSFCSSVSIFNMRSKFSHMVDPLLTNKYGSSF